MIPHRNPIRLPSGQQAHLRHGRVEVMPSDGRRYRLTVEHRDGGTLYATCRDYSQLLEFLSQAQRLHYELRLLEVVPPPEG